MILPPSVINSAALSPAPSIFLKISFCPTPECLQTICDELLVYEPVAYCNVVKIKCLLFTMRGAALVIIVMKCYKAGWCGVHVVTAYYTSLLLKILIVLKSES